MAGWVPKGVSSSQSQQGRLADSKSDEMSDIKKWDPMKEDYSRGTAKPPLPINTSDSSSHHGSESRSEDDLCKVYVTNIPHNGVNKEKLNEMMSMVGVVKDIIFITQNPDNPYSYAFVTFNSPRDALSAIKRFNGMMIEAGSLSRPIVVKHSIPKNLRQQRSSLRKIYPQPQSGNSSIVTDESVARMEKDQSNQRVNVASASPNVGTTSVSNCCPKGSVSNFVKLNTGATVPLMTVCVEDNNMFWCVINTPEVEKSLEQFSEFINQQSLEPFTGQPFKGALVVAPFEGINYRAVVLSVLSPQLVRVLFVDFGNKENIEVSDLKVCRQERFITFPYQALQCSFAQAKQYENATALGAVKENYDFLAEVVSCTDRLHLLRICSSSRSEQKLSCVERCLNITSLENSCSSIASPSESATTPVEAPSVSSRSNGVVLDVGGVYNATVTSVSGSNFYIRLNDPFSQSIYEVFCDQLSRDNALNLPESSSLEKDTLCMYLTQDNKKRRGRICYSTEDGCHLVISLDSGEKSVVPTSQIYPMNPVYSQLNPLALLCVSRDSNAQATVNSNVLCKVLDIETAGNSRKHVVQLLPVVIDSPPPNTSTSSSLPSQCNNSPLPSSPDTRLSILSPGVCSPLPFCHPALQQKDDTPQSPIINMDMEPEFDECSSSSQVIPNRRGLAGSSFSAILSHFSDDDDDEFYVHLFENSCVADMQAVTSMMLRLSSTSPPNVIQSQSLTKGTAAVVRDPSNNKHYRAEILNDITPSDTEIAVVCVDFGHTLVVPRNYCFQATVNHILHPKLAIHCALDPSSRSSFDPTLKDRIEGLFKPILSLSFKQALPCGKYLVELTDIQPA